MLQILSRKIYVSLFNISRLHVFLCLHRKSNAAIYWLYSSLHFWGPVVTWKFNDVFKKIKNRKKHRFCCLVIQQPRKLVENLIFFFQQFITIWYSIVSRGKKYTVIGLVPQINNNFYMLLKKKLILRLVIINHIFFTLTWEDFLAIIQDNIIIWQ